jgi:hypothetical protein
MGYRVIGKDADVTIASGGAWDGSHTIGTATNIKLLAKSVRCQDIGDTLTIAAIGDTQKFHRPGQTSYRVEVDLYIDSTGIIGLSKGDVARLVLDPLATTTTTGVYTYDGVVDETTLEVSGQDQVQRIVILGPAEGTTT